MTSSTSPEVDSREVTPEEIAHHYTAALDSVTLIDELAEQESLTEEDTATVSRNVEHLELMVKRDYWTDEDLSPFEQAITKGSGLL